MYLHKDPGSFTDISRQLGERYNSIGNLDFITQKKNKFKSYVKFRYEGMERNRRDQHPVKPLN